jgi:hypothetical protein
MINEWILSLAYAFIIGTLGEVAKGLTRAKAGDTGWRGVYFVTYKAHGLVVGALGAVLMHPYQVKIPEQFGGESLASFVIWGATCGGAAMVGYAATMGIASSWLQHKQEAARRGDL